MTAGTFNSKCRVFAFILIFFCSACTDQNLISGEGTLKGKISIGPLCPVETDPPLPGCLPTMDTYRAWATAIWSPNKKTKLAVLTPTLDGAFQIDLPAGSYIIDFDNPQNNRIGGSNLPAQISVTDGDTTSFNINIDTGIR